MGHQKIAGRATEQSIAGGAFLRVGVPDGEGGIACTRYFGTQAIYAINPTTEEIAIAMAEHCRAEPISPYDLPRIEPCDV